MNVSLLYINTSKPFSEYEKYLSYVLPERLDKIQNYKFDRDKTLSLLSHLFARHKISEELKIPFKKVEFSYNEHGKPYVQKDDFYFSISHSDNVIAFVSHTSPIGIDVQKRTSSITGAIRFFTENEKMYIAHSADRFIEIWTKKEAYVKMLGTGLSTPFKTFDVLSDDISGMLFYERYDDFHLSICGKNIPKLQINTDFVN